MTTSLLRFLGSATGRGLLAVNHLDGIYTLQPPAEN